MKTYSAERKAAVVRKLLPPSNMSVAELVKQEGISGFRAMIESGVRADYI
jgi:hypothetical protein